MDSDEGHLNDDLINITEFSKFNITTKIGAMFLDEPMKRGSTNKTAVNDLSLKLSKPRLLKVGLTTHSLW